MLKMLSTEPWMVTNLGQAVARCSPSPPHISGSSRPAGYEISSSTLIWISIICNFCCILVVLSFFSTFNNSWHLLPPLATFLFTTLTSFYFKLQTSSIKLNYHIYNGCTIWCFQGFFFMIDVNLFVVARGGGGGGQSLCFASQLWPVHLHLPL